MTIKSINLGLTRFVKASLKDVSGYEITIRVYNEDEFKQLSGLVGNSFKNLNLKLK